MNFITELGLFEQAFMQQDGSLYIAAAAIKIAKCDMRISGITIRVRQAIKEICWATMSFIQ